MNFRTTAITAQDRHQIADLLIDRIAGTYRPAEVDHYRYLRTQILNPDVTIADLRKTCVTVRDHADMRMYNLAEQHAAWDVIACELDKFTVYQLFIQYIRRYR